MGLFSSTYTLAPPVPPIPVVLPERALVALEKQAAAMTRLADASERQTLTLGEVRDTLKRVLRALRKIAKPRSATNLRFRLLREINKEGAMDQIVFALSADASADADVTKRELTLTLNPGQADEAVLAKVTADPGTTEFTHDDAGSELMGPEGGTVKASLVDVDDAGNPAAPAEITFQLVDTFAPQSAGGLGVRFVREIPDGPTPPPTPPSP